MNYLEFDQHLIDQGRYPSTLCVSNMLLYANRKAHDANRIYNIEGNNLTEIKNRNEPLKSRFISDEDIVVLKLRAVLI